MKPHKRGDTYKGAAITISKNLTGATVAIQFRRKDNGQLVKELTNTSGLTVLADTTSVVTIQPFDVAMPIGDYVGEFIVTDAGVKTTYFDITWKIVA